MVLEVSAHYPLSLFFLAHSEAGHHSREHMVEQGHSPHDRQEAGSLTGKDGDKVYSTRTLVS